MNNLNLLVCYAAAAALFVLGSLSFADAQTSTLPRFRIADLQYEGAFRMPQAGNGASNMNFSEGPLEYNPDNNSIFIVGHSHHQAIAEYPVPELVNSTTLTDLNMAAAPLQVFSTVLGRAASGNPQNINRIGGLEYVNSPSPQLLINGYEYYDADGNVTHTTLVARNATAIATSQIDGYYQFQGGAGHTSGWISPISQHWQGILGGTHITGQSSGIPIISRTSVGPSAFAFNPTDFLGGTVPTPVPTTKLLDFSLQNPLNSDLSNSSGTNNLWTHLSRVVYGFIAPGTRTYITLGHSGGHNSGVCYKCTQNNGNTCGGYCTPDAADNYHYYWLWDLNDLVDVKEGRVNAHDVRPYEYGVFPTAFTTHHLGGGTFDPATGLLYLTVQRADDQQGQYANPPVIVVYRFNSDADTTPPAAPQQLRRILP